MRDLKGIFSALLVSFNEDGTINEKGLRQIIRHNIDKMKVDGLYVGGSTGENFMLSTEEKKEIFRIAKDEAKDQIALIAQVGSVNLKEAVELGKYATELGYDSLSAVTPFYYPLSFNEIKHYYKTIIDATDNSMILYYIPFLTGVKISLDQFAELLEDEKVIGVKYTAADFYQLERFRKRFPNKLIWSGFDEMLVQAAITGVDGAIGSTYNVNGQTSKKIFELAKEGKVAEAYELQHEANYVIEKVLELGLYQTLKEILKVKGVGPKAYEQMAGFLVIPEGENILDNTVIHPESYAIAEALLEKIGFSLEKYNNELNEARERLKSFDYKKFAEENNFGAETVKDVYEALLKDRRDPRDDFEKPLLKSDILNIDNLEVGMELEGTVRNVVKFGAFVDIGLKNDALLHISEISNKYIDDPSKVLAVGQIIKVRIKDVDKDRGRVGLTKKEQN